jgi:4-cresol dehydrogenase (hydroxylating) flavoprotein subunit
MLHLLLGDAGMTLDPALLRAAESATYGTTRRILGIIEPANREEVQAVIRLANEHQQRLYPISTGKNWGYGSRVPPVEDCWLLSLARLNRIIAYDAKLAYVQLEPGVTFRQLDAFLQAQGGRLRVAAPGTTADASVIANGLSRGIGQGVFGERCESLCNLVVILPDGSLIETGYGRYEGAVSTALARYAPGPALDGLFFQSSLGVVVAASVWLAPIPPFYQGVKATVERQEQLQALVDGVQSLRLGGMLPAGASFFNDLRLLTVSGQYPFEQTDERLLSTELRSRLVQQQEGGRWNLLTAIEGYSLSQLIAVQQLVEADLKQICDTLVFSPINSPNPFYSRHLPTSVHSVYWRKRTAIPETVDPDRDGCGVIWYSAVLPFTGSALVTVEAGIEAVLTDSGYEPILSVQALTPRTLTLIGVLLYDRHQPGEDERAWRVYNAVQERLNEQGYFPYRLPVHSHALPPANSAYAAVIERLKLLFDPYQLLASTPW